MHDRSLIIIIIIITLVFGESLQFVRIARNGELFDFPTLFDENISIGWGQNDFCLSMI